MATLGPVKIMAMGDSNTYGVISWLNNKEAGGYRFHLDQKLKSAGLAFDMVGSQRNGPLGFDRDHEGYNGIQSDGLAGKAAGILSANKPDVILLMAGSNDAKTDSVSKMVADMKHLLDTLKAQAPNAQVLVAGVPPAREGNTAGISPTKIAQYNAELPGVVAAKKAAGMKVGFVDTSALTVNDISTIQADGGVHLNATGVEKLAGIWFNALKSLGVKDGTIDAGRSGAGDEAPSGSTGNPVKAVDDDFWKTDAGKTMWQNARYLTWNDVGPDGGLKVTAVASKSAAGASVSFASDGTITYKPVANWQGKDWVEYTLSDIDGSTDTGLFYVQVGTGTHTPPVPTEPAPTPPPSGGTGNPVTAVDDSMWKTGVNQTMWQNARYLTWNDVGPDGGLKVTAVASKSAAGAGISFASDGTITYKPVANWQGKDWVEYTVSDADGSTDTGKFYVQVGTYTPPAPTEPAPTPPPSGGSGNPVTAVDDHWNVKASSTHYFNTRYVLQNDKALDGGLKIASIGTTTAKGGTISWDASTGTTIYKPKAGFVGKDSVAYTAVDVDGSTDSAVIHFDVLLA